MKISNSKKELAKIISENGGWIGATELSAQDSDGWIEWKGEPKSPVANGVMVDVRLKGGAYHEAELLDNASWSDTWGNESIIAYRLHKPERAKSEFCESVMRSIPEPEAKPTIEQLAADYRNKLDYVDRKRGEADKAKIESDAALSELEKAIAAIGFAITPIGVVAQESELVITDWRDLQLNDIIEYVDGYIKDKFGMTGPVVEFAPGATDGMMVRMKCDNGPRKGLLGWPMKWRFIRRPAK